MIGFKAKRVLKIGLKSLWMHKMRSGLTMLGITFGVCSVIAMLAIGEGASGEALRQIERLGSHNIIVQSVEPPEMESGSAERSRMKEYGLTYADAERIRDMLPYVQVTVPARRVRRRASHGSRRFDTDIVGTVPWYAEVGKARLVAGRFLTALDMHGRANVCVLGSRAAKLLFPFDDAIGSVIMVEKLRYRVVGIISAFAPTEIGGKKLRGDPNLEVYVPLTTLKSHFGETIFSRGTGTYSVERVEIHDLIVKVNELESVIPTEKAIATILKQSHKKQDYQIIVPYELLLQARETQRLWNIVLGAIAAISLLVGGIGIMNITLATVLERTREIGIRRAMGAKQIDIVIQFLTETVLLAIFGGTLGIGLGLLVPFLVTLLTNMPTDVTAWSLILAFGISATIGLLFGIYPAYRAAEMDPIEALRHE